jgi:uncharacterized membrane protein YjdF
MAEHKPRVMAEMFQFLRTQKKYWLAPVIVVMLLLGVILIAAKGSALAPFIYTLF